jgi:hypothetical protein
MASAHLSVDQEKAHSQNWALTFTDEASFRQNSTLHATSSRPGHPPEVAVTGEPKNVQDPDGDRTVAYTFPLSRGQRFQCCQLLGILEQLALSYRRRGAILIQNKASDHQHADVWS